MKIGHPLQLADRALERIDLFRAIHAADAVFTGIIHPSSLPAVDHYDPEEPTRNTNSMLAFLRERNDAWYAMKSDYKFMCVPHTYENKVITIMAPPPAGRRNWPEDLSSDQTEGSEENEGGGFFFLRYLRWLLFNAKYTRAVV